MGCWVGGLGKLRVRKEEERRKCGTWGATVFSVQTISV